MPSLREQQRLLQLAILAEERFAPQLAREESPRLGVYRHGYRARLAGALRENYPALARAMGDEEFERVANDYARAHPSRHYSIRWHGHALAAFLAEGALADLARMEWALGIAFDAHDATSADAHWLARVPVDRWGELPLGLHPSVSVVPMRWAVEAGWQALRESEAGDVPPPREHPHVLLVWRKALEAHWRIATDAEGRALLGLRAGGTLQRACEASGEEAGRVGEWFAGWVREGMLVLPATHAR
ncbi:MAG TPA: DNA-binding domain-containing protein [Usitatibacter sp.]|nr:DNA-binding domain-containing protein [Usitatibacter sp.]